MLWTHPKHWKWKWLGLQIGLPLLGPILLSLFIAGGVKSLQPDVPLSREVIVDVTPWALIFFTMALLGGGIHDYWSAAARPPVAVIIFLFVVGAAVLIYVSLIVGYRLQHPGVSGVPGTGVWVVTFILLAASIVVCHEAA